MTPSNSTPPARPPADPALDALRRTPLDQPALLLHSGRHHPRWASRSLLAVPRVWFRFTSDRRSELTRPDGTPVPRSFSHDLFADLRALLDDSAFPGRWVGYLSYDIARLIEPSKLSEIPPHISTAPPSWP